MHALNESCIITFNRIILNSVPYLYYSVLLDRELSKFPDVLDFCKSLYADRYRSPYLMGYMVDTYEEMLEQGCGDKQETLDKASEVNRSSSARSCNNPKFSDRGQALANNSHSDQTYTVCLYICFFWQFSLWKDLFV